MSAYLENLKGWIGKKEVDIDHVTIPAVKRVWILDKNGALALKAEATLN